MENIENVEEDKVFMAKRQFFVVAQRAQENAAQVCVQRF